MKSYHLHFLTEKNVEFVIRILFKEDEFSVDIESIKNCEAFTVKQWDRIMNLKSFKKINDLCLKLQKILKSKIINIK